LLRSLFARSQKTRPASARPQIEPLEDRAVPAITTPMAGSPGPVTLTGTAGADQFVIRLKANATSPTLQVSDNNGGTFTDVAVSDATQITVNGLAGNDTLTIDNGNGLVGNAKTGGLAITFNGGTGTDRLVLSGSPSGASVNETYNFGTTRGSGTISVSTGGTGGTGGTGAKVTLTGTEGVTDTLTAASPAINASDQRDLLRLVNGDATAGGATFRLESIVSPGEGLLRRHDFDDDDEGDDDQGEDVRGDDNDKGNDNGNDNGRHRGDDNEHNRGLRGLGAFSVPITFSNKAAVTINLNGGNDFLLVNASTAAAGLTNLTVNGGSGFDVVAVRNLASSVTASYPQVERVLTSLDQIFIEELYQLRLNRFADDGGMGNWQGILFGRGRRAVLEGILRSDEALGFVVNDLYVKLLGRQADQGGLNGFVASLRNGGTLEQVITSIATSPEFQTRAAQLGGTGMQQEPLIRTLYLTLLDRDATDQEVANAVSAAKVSGVAAVVDGIVRSEEFRRLEVTALYQALLDRLPDVPGLNGWVHSTLNLLTIRAGLMDSDEFFERG